MSTRGLSDRKSGALRLALGGMLALATAMGIGRFVYTPALPGMMQALGLSASDGGLIASANFLGYLAGALLGGGRWANGRERAIMLASLCASAVLCLAMAMAQTVNIFMVLRFSAGVASAFTMLFCSAIVLGALASRGEKKLQDIHFAGVGAGIALSSFLVLGLALADVRQWMATWIFAGAISFVGFVLVWWLIPAGLSRSQLADASGRLQWSAPLKRVIACFGLFGAGYSVSATFLIALARQQGASTTDEAFLWLLVGVMAAVSVIAGSAIARRAGLVRTLVALCIAEAVGVAACVVLPAPFGIYLGAILFGATFMAITALALEVASSLAPGHARQVFAHMTVSFSVGQIVGPLLAGLVVDATGDYLLASLGAATVLVAAALVVWPVRT